MGDPPKAGASVNPLRCPGCGHHPIEPRWFPWKKTVALMLKCTLLLWPMGQILTAKPDWDQCPKCGRKKVNL